MLVVGLNTSGYVSSAAFVKDGELMFASAEERFDRQKQSKYFPWKAIDAGLLHLGAELADVDCFAIGYNPGISIAGRMRAGFSEWPAYPGARLFSNPNHLLPELHGSEISETVQIFPRKNGTETRLRYVTHHVAHASNAFLLSNFDEAAILTCDGYGERTTTAFGKATRSGLSMFREISYPHSLGSLYATITQFLGFRPHSDEWKVMGAAAFGDARRFGDAFEKLMTWNRSAEYEIDLSYFNFFDFDVSPMYSPKLEALLGPSRHRGEVLQQHHYDIAASLQDITERYLLDALSWLHQETGCSSVCLAGGVLMNSVFNGKASTESPFSNVFIPYAPDDNGNSIGAALWVAWQELGKSLPLTSANPFLGRSWNSQEIREILDRYKVSYQEPEEIAAAVANLLAKQKIVGWFQGRSEFGDRALGARSILADPRDPRMKDRINSAVKYREMFRPFAPAVPEEDQTVYFSLDKTVPAPFMERVFSIRKEKRELIPAVVHADGSGRVQTVSAATNPLFHRLLRSFQAKTEIPVLLNTSFNVNGEPIVESPSDALRTYFTSGLDALAIGPFLLTKDTAK